MIWRLACRSLRGAPVSTTMAVLSLGLGIGATTALFSIVDSLVLRTLPVRDPASLVVASNGRNSTAWTNPQWEQIRQRRDLAGGAFAWARSPFNLSMSGERDIVNGLYASGELFEILGVHAVVGRMLLGGDDQRGGGKDGPVAVMSYGLWQRRYGGAADVIGRRITLDRVPFTIVGVAPRTFLGLEAGSSFDVAVPIGTETLVKGADSGLDDRSYSWLSVMARLRPGQTMDQAIAAFRRVQSEIRNTTTPPDLPAADLKDYLQEPFQLAAAAGGESGLRERYRRPLTLLTIASALMLLIACASIANLMLGRAIGRRHELAVRAALGASRSALAWPLLAESLLIAATGAAFGLLLSRWAADVLIAGLSSTTNQVVLDMSMNWTVFGFTLAISTGAAVVFGSLPALRASRANPQEALAERGRASTGSGGIDLGGGFVIAQVALSLVLVVCAGVFARNFAALATRQLGFESDAVLVARIWTRQTQARTPAAQKALLERVRVAARGVPGVRDASLSVVTPVSGAMWMFGVEVVGEAPRLGPDANVHVNVVTPDWFSTYGTRLLAGRDVDDHDVAGAPRVALVNEAFVRHFLRGQPAVGRLLNQVPASPPKPPVEIIGVVGDAVYRSPREPVPPTIYLSLAQENRPLNSVSLSVRAAGVDPSALIQPLAVAMSGVDPNLAFSFGRLADQVGGALIQERQLAMLSGFFGVLALLLAALGLYGVTSYAVSRRRGEIGIRMALGGSRGTVVRQMLGRVAAFVFYGVVLGGVASYWAARFIKPLVYGLEPRDPTTFAVCVMILAAAALLAAWIPARRASRVDPATVLRDI